MAGVNKIHKLNYCHIYTMVLILSMKLGRRFIKADINLGSIQTTTKRLISVSREIDENTEISTGFEVYNIYNMTIEEINIIEDAIINN